MPDWPRVPVRQLCELIVDCVNRTAPVVEYETPYRMIRTTNVRDGRIDLSSCRYVEKEIYERWTRRAKVLEGDVILTREAPIGEVGFVSDLGPVFLGQRIMQYRADQSKIEPRYLFYAFCSRDLQHQFGTHDGSGSVVSHIRVADCHNFKVPTPPINEQQAIAETLGSLDDKIELNRRMNATLEGMAQAIFRDWFVDFGPTRRKQAGVNDPVEIMGRLLPDPTRAQALADLFPASFGDKGLPEGWQEQPIGDLAEIVGGSTPSTKSPEFWDSGTHAWATPKDLSKLDGLFLFRTERQITEEGLERIGSGLSPKGTVLLSSRAPIGYLAIAETPVAVNQGFIALRPTVDMPTAYALFWCRQNMDTIKANANGSTFQEISKKNFRPLTAIMPKTNLLHAFTDVVDPLLAKIRQNLTTNQKLVETRDFLLPKLMSGEVRVSSNVLTA